MYPLSLIMLPNNLSASHYDSVWSNIVKVNYTNMRCTLIIDTLNTTMYTGIQKSCPTNNA